MSPLIKKYYNNWLSSPTLYIHPLDMKRFYVFVKIVGRYSKKHKDGQWLRYFLKRDLSQKYKDSNYIEKITKKIVYLFDHLLDFNKISLPYQHRDIK